MQILKAYYVWPKFPSLSLSGRSCSLSCKHCEGKYLRNMIPTTNEDALLKICKDLEKRDCIGVLLSGGCDKYGNMLNLERLIKAMKKVKKETNLIIKLHTGFVSKNLAEELVNSIDIASMEMIGDELTIKEIFGLNASPQDYINTFINLQDAGIKYIAPHICVGLYYSQLRGEFNALNLLKENNIKPSTLVIIVLRPTKNTKLQNLEVIKGKEVAKVVKKAKQLFSCDIALGCMRPRSSNRNDTCSRNEREEIEINALDNGITRIEIPSENTIKYAIERGFAIKKINGCCVLPEEFENRTV